MAVKKLGQIEDILEKYGIESVEELDFRLAFKQNDVANYKYISQLEQDRDTWKKACELACGSLINDDGKETLVFLKTGIQVKNSKQAIDYFYQQAKEKNNDPE